jgi:hypothetical protein
MASRRVSIVLGVGILLLPLMFSWFTLRHGYSARARIITFLWLSATLVFGLVTTVLAPPAPPEVWAIPG